MHHHSLILINSRLAAEIGFDRLARGLAISEAVETLDRLMARMQGTFQEDPDFARTEVMVREAKVETAHVD